MWILSETGYYGKFFLSIRLLRETKGDCSPGNSKELANVKLYVTPRGNGVICKFRRVFIPK